MDKSTSDSSQHKPALSNRKLFIFKIIAIFIPVLFIVLFELLLRWIHYGHDMRLFVEDDVQKQCWVMNPYASQKYFVQSDNATIGLHEPFLKKKPANTYRIFVLGESTTLGFPYHEGSFHYWLKYRLMHTFPEKNIEIVNLSLTAVNSITVYDFANEVIHYQPDAVLVYVGHNEYYGALGVGSTSNIGNNLPFIRFKLKCRQLRLVQLLTNMYQRFFVKSTGLSNQQMMRKMASDQHIVYQSDSYYKGIHQFEKNMLDLCKVFSDNKIPLLVSNLVSNEKDLEPFISDTTVADNSAIFHYHLAQDAYKRGDYKKAKREFVLAKDLDMLRFRAPEAINNSIERIAQTYPGVYFVDSKSTFEAHSPHGIIGSETILEHVHPNLFGYALISDAFYNVMIHHHLLIPERRNEMSFEVLLKQMPVLKVDSLCGVYVIAHMKQEWPFRSEHKDFQSGTSFEEVLCRRLEKRDIPWNEALDTMLTYYKSIKDWNAASKTAETAMLIDPRNVKVYLAAAFMCEKLKDFKRMLFYMKKAFILQPTSILGQKIVALCLYVDQPEIALPYLDSLIAREPSNPVFSQNKNALFQLVKMKQSLSSDSTNVILLNYVASAYCSFQNKPVATYYLKRAFQIDPNNIESKSLQMKIALMKDDTDNPAYTKSK